MSDTQSQHGEEEFGEDSTPIVPLPYFWKLIQDQSENPKLEQLVADALNQAPLKSAADDDDEEPEDDEEEGASKNKADALPPFDAALKEVHPDTKETLLQWATREGFTKVVEILATKAQQANLVTQLATFDDTHKNIYDRYAQERERVRLLEEKNRRRAENPDDEDEEEPEEDGEEGEEKLDFATKLSREFGTEKEPQGDEEEAEIIPFEKKKIEEIGELGIFNGSYKPPTDEQLQQEELEEEDNRSLHTYKFIREGQGQMLFLNGDIFVGNYENNERNGLGTYLFVSRMPKVVVKSEDEDEDEEEKKPVEEEPETSAKFLAWYSGEWKNGKKTGSGVMFYPDGSKYHGDFLENKRHGQGTITFPNNDTYTGNWKNDRKDGAGEYKFANDKSQYAGQFQKGVFSEGQWKLSNGIYYEGAFGSTGQPEGKGVMSYKVPGVKQNGVFRNQRWYGNDSLVRV
uniref:Uncharacterized protein n=1 Tax=Percolomonas cosmopolitus TaxID=63605 RepID=A0A7S1KNQ7_9EUKA|eukprot:CAMPEP_0117446674 /NCGR_PEP_ID=MMETSP0759-20121206/6471_1 /TAXON_ID=63605 /ORGANISM="Percolomonas cosmopolitus, Strain WS" /LENGTH=458 /DNA_ID=CAMNT_0005238965 /DNA_START=2876 /DNA_END=4252 /DNA_ORIENTATION=-